MKNPATAVGAGAGFGEVSCETADSDLDNTNPSVLRRTPTAIDHGVAEFLARDEHQDGSAELLDWAARERIDLRPAFDLDVAMSVLRVEFLPGGGFEFAEDEQGVPAFITLMLDTDAETAVDIVATDIARPARFATLLGIGEVLGLDRALNPATFFAGRALRLSRNPIEWLRAGCEGAVILVPEAAWRIIPAITGPVVLDNLDDARRLVKAAEGFIDPGRVLVREAA